MGFNFGFFCRDGFGDWGLKQVDGFGVVGLSRFGLDEVVEGKKGLKLGEGRLRKGDVPGIEGSTPFSTVYLLDILQVNARVRDAYK